MATVVVEDCTVLRRTPWTNRREILTLISRERACFSASFHLPDEAKAKPGRDLQPGLFEEVRATFRPHPEGRHRLVAFEVLQSSPTLERPDLYPWLCLISRVLSRCIQEHAGDPQPLALWKAHLQPRGDLPWLEWLCDLHFTLGTFPREMRCEVCGTLEGVGVSGRQLICNRCDPQRTALQEQALLAIRQRFSRRGPLVMKPEDATLLSRLLADRLPVHLQGDGIAQHLLRTLARS